MLEVTIRFYEELNDYLPEEKRKREFTRFFDHSATLRELVESFGIPPNEVDLMLVNGLSVDFSYIVSDGDRVSVYPIFETFDISGVTKVREKPLREGKCYKRKSEMYNPEPETY